MYKTTFTTDELKELKIKEKEHQGNRKILRRVKSIILRREGMKPRKIAEKLDVSQDSITDWIKLYNKWWIAALCWFKYEDRRLSKYAKHEKGIRNMINKKTYNTVVELHNAVELKFGVGVKPDAFWKFCKKKWMRPVKNVKSDLEECQTNKHKRKWSKKPKR